MNLGEIREQIVKLSGLVHLVDDEGGDAGMDFYIKAGQRYLDRKLGEMHPKSQASAVIILGQDQCFVQLSGCRSVSSVWVIDETGGKTELKNYTLSQISTAYGSLESVNSGTPNCYVPATLRTSPDFKKLTSSLKETFLNVIGAASINSNAFDGLLIVPPSNDGLRLEVVGSFYTPELVYDIDTNFWSSRYPEVLMKAALREVEVFNRNSSGVKDWELAILLDIEGIMMDFVDHESAGTITIQG